MAHVAGTPQFTTNVSGNGHVTETGGGTLLSLGAQSQGYSNAQLDDTSMLMRSEFLWSPPLKFSLSARASSESHRGTLGFGFWNDPFSMGAGNFGARRSWPAPPSALWFFYNSRPGDMTLIAENSGMGWRAMSFHLSGTPLPALAMLGGIAVVGSLIPRIRERFIKAAGRLSHYREASLIQSLRGWASYEIRWGLTQAEFLVNQQVVLTVDAPPTGPLGFVLWIDNQFAVISQRGPIRFGVLPTKEDAWLEVERLQILRE